MAFNAGSVTAKLTADINTFVGQINKAKDKFANFASNSAKSLEKTNSKLKAYQDRVAALVRQKQTLNNQLKLTIAKFGEQSIQAQKLRDKIANVGDRTDTLRLKLKEAGKQKTIFQNLSTSAQKFGDKITSVVKSAGLALGVGAAALSGYGVKLAMSFESQLSSIKALTGATKKQMEDVAKLSMTLGAQTKYSALEAAQGAEELLKAGVPLAKVMGGALAGALDLAAAGGLAVADAAEIASTVLNAFRKDNLSVAQSADILAGAANASATSVQELKFGLAQSAAVASGVGLSFKDTATALSVFAQNGLKGSDAGTSLKSMLLRLSPATEKAESLFVKFGFIQSKTTTAFKLNTAQMAKNKDKIQELQKKISILNLKQKEWTKNTKESTKATQRAQLAKYQKQIASLGGVIGKNVSSTKLMGNVFFDSKGKLKDLASISGILKDKLKDLSNEQRISALQTLFGTDAIRAANILYGEGTQGIKDMQKAMMGFTAQDVASEKTKNLAGAFERLRGSIDTKLIELFSKPLPQLTVLLSKIETGINNIDINKVANFGMTFFNALTTAYNIGSKFIGFLSKHWNLISSFGEAVLVVATAFTVYAKAVALVTLLSTPMNLALAATVVAFMAVYTAVRFLSKNQAFQNWLKGILGWLDKVGKKIGEFVTNIDKIKDPMKSFKEGGNKAIDKVRGFFGMKNEKRENGGPVVPGRLYEVGEKDKPEMFMSNGKQYMIPGNKGQVLNQNQITNKRQITINQYGNNLNTHFIPSYGF